MTDPRFSIVIPTRDRHDTLQYTLQTCLEQDFDRFEIVVSDNGSTPHTEQLITALADPRIRYVHTPRPLAMTNNFEYAVDHARGEYVIVIGDDDGLLPGALRSLDAIARETGEKAIGWDSSYYYWPSMLHPQKRNTASMPAGGQTVRLNGLQMIDNVINYELYYTLLPMLYHAAVHRDLIAELKARTGRVFFSRSPDLYSGLAVAFVAGNYLHTGTPYSVMGISGKSTGMGVALNQGQVIQDFVSVNQEDRVACHPKALDVNALIAFIADSFLFAKDGLFPGHTLHYDEKCFVINVLLDNYQPDREAETIRRIRDYLADKPMLTTWFNTALLPNLASVKAELAQQAPPPACVSPTIVNTEVQQAYGVNTIADLTRNYWHIVADQTRHLQKRAL